MKKFFVFIVLILTLIPVRGAYAAKSDEEKRIAKQAECDKKDPPEIAKKIAGLWYCVDTEQTKQEKKCEKEEGKPFALLIDGQWKCMTYDEKERHECETEHPGWVMRKIKTNPISCRERLTCVSPADAAEIDKVRPLCDGNIPEVVVKKNGKYICEYGCQDLLDGAVEACRGHEDTHQILSDEEDRDVSVFICCDKGYELWWHGWTILIGNDIVGNNVGNFMADTGGAGYLCYSKECYKYCSDRGRDMLSTDGLCRCAEDSHAFRELSIWSEAVKCYNANPGWTIRMVNGEYVCMSMDDAIAHDKRHLEIMRQDCESQQKTLTEIGLNIYECTTPTEGLFYDLETLEKALIKRLRELSVDE